MARYKDLLFDADGTLFDFDRAEHEALRKTLDQAGIFFDNTVFACYHAINQALWQRHERGEITREQIQQLRFTELLEALHLTGDGVALNQSYVGFLGEGAYLLEDAFEVCERLSKSHRLYIVTNGIFQTQTRRFEKSGLLPFFEGVFISEQTGYQKPQREYFDYVFAHIPDFDKKKTLIIGDSLTSDIKGGNNAGIDCCWYNPQENEGLPGIFADYMIQRLDALYQLV